MKAWSYSALSSFETCPKKHFTLNVAKSIKEDDSEAMIWGNQVHKAIENYMARDAQFPLGMRQYAKVCDALKGAAKAKGSTQHTELKLALDEQFQPSSWYGDHVWVRGIVDYAITNKDRAAVFDWKTGKRKENEEQLALTAAIMFAQMEELQIVDSAFVWLQEAPARQINRTVYTRDQLPEIWGMFLPRVERYQEAFKRDEFPAKPNNLCRRFCPVKSCPYHGT